MKKNENEKQIAFCSDYLEKNIHIMEQIRDEIIRPRKVGDPDEQLTQQAIKLAFEDAVNSMKIVLAEIKAASMEYAKATLPDSMD